MRYPSLFASKASVLAVENDYFSLVLWGKSEQKLIYLSCKGCLFNFYQSLIFQIEKIFCHDCLLGSWFVIIIVNIYKKFEIVNLRIVCTISNFYIVKVFWLYFINDVILVPLFYFLAIQPFLPLILHIQSLSSFVVSMFFRP